MCFLINKMVYETTKEREEGKRGRNKFKNCTYSIIGQSFGCELECRIHRMSNLNISTGNAIEKKHYNLLAPGLSNKVSWVDSPGIILENFKPFYTLFVSPPKI